MAEDVNALYASTLERGKNVRKGIEQMVEIPFWLYPEKPKWVSGIRGHTSVRDILLSLVRSDSKATFDENDVREKRLFLVEQWRGVEKPLSQSSSILKIWNAWGDERNQVRFVVKKMSSSSTKNVDYATFKNVEKSSKNVEKSMKSVEMSLNDSKRKMRRRRNSVSSAGSFADEPHPRRLAQMSEVEMSQRLIEKTQRLVEMSQVKKDRGDVFDEHIEEMMKIIVTQGKRICDELKRVQQDVSTTSSPRSNQDRRPRRRSAQDENYSSRNDANKMSQDKVSSFLKSVQESSNIEILPTLNEVSFDKSDCSATGDNSSLDISKGSKSLPVKSSDISTTENTLNKSEATLTQTKSDDNSNRRVRMLPKIPLNAKMFDINKRVLDMSISDVLNTSKESSSSSQMENSDIVKRTLGQSANSTLDITTIKSQLGSNPSLDNSQSRESPNVSLKEQKSEMSDQNASNRSLGKRANSSLDMSSVSQRSILKQNGLDNSLSRSIADLSQGNISNQIFPDQSPIPSLSKSLSSNNVCQYRATLLADQKSSNQMSDVADNFAISKIVENLEIFSFELSHLATMNDKLQFAEESVDRLEIALSHQHRHLQQQQEQQQLRRSGSIPNLTLNGDAAKEHLFCARSEVERLRVINENVGREISENQKHLHNLDAAVKSKRSALKALEYDVNVIEKEGRKLAKELDKVMNIKIENIFASEEILLLDPDIPIPDTETEDSVNESAEIESELNVIADSGSCDRSKIILSGHSSFEGRTSVTGTPESSSSGNSSGSSSEKSVRFCLDRRKPDPSSSVRFVKSSGKVRESSGDVDNNSDTGLSSLHSSSDEGTYEIGTLV